MAEAVLGAVIGSVTKELISLIPKPRLLKKTVQELEKLLTEIRNDHEEVNESIKSIRWRQNFTVLYEDVREDVGYWKKDMQKPSISRWIKQAVKPNSTLENELKSYTKRYKEFCKRREMLCGPLERDEERTRTIVGSSSSEPILFGRDSEFIKIIDLLEMPSGVENGCDFIAIVGMGGIGKTTLAQFVYNYDKVASFTERVWCYVSGLNICQIYRSMLEHLVGDCNFQDTSAMLERLLKELKGKKCLIVFDDFSNEKEAELDALRALLMAANPGSKFIMTTRNRAVAKRFTRGEERIINLGLMTNKDCWSLFCSGTSLDSNSTSNLATIGKEICDKCGGLPLTVIKAKEKFFGIDTEAAWRTVQSKIASDVTSVIRVSYEKLPIQLRTCFSYFSMFPPGQILTKEGIVNFWLRGGIISDEYQSKEEVAGECFDDLVSRTLIMKVVETCFDNPGSRKLVSYNGLNRYEMHDTIRCMANKVSGGTGGIWGNGVGVWENVRYLNIRKEMTAQALEILKSIPVTLLDLKKLFIDCENFEKLEDMDVFFMKLPHSKFLFMHSFKFAQISKKLVHMRRLQDLHISHCDSLKKLPALSKLNNLSTFAIYNCNSLTGPILVELGILTMLTKLSIEYCGGLTGPIPSELGNLKMLRKFVITECGGLTGPIPPKLGGLTMLKLFIIRYCKGLTGQIPPELGGLKMLNKFTICGCKGLTGPIPCELGYLTMLKELSIFECEGLTGSIPPELGGLTMLNKLNVSNCRGLTGPIPTELGNLTMLKELHLRMCKGLTGPIPLKLGGLKMLSILTIRDCEGLTGPILPELGGLTMLKKLAICKCKGLIGPIPLELGNLMMLKKLSICECKGLTGSIPLTLGGLRKLKELNICECEGLTGSIPLELGSLKQLKTLNFSKCIGLTGPIPLELCGLIQLKTLDLSNCIGLTGHIPSELARFILLKKSDLSMCEGLIGLIPLELIYESTEADKPNFHES